MKVKKVIIIEPSGNLWGSERVLLDFLSVVNSSEYDITVCYPADSLFENELKNKDVNRLPVYGKNMHQKSVASRIFFSLKLTVQIIKQRPDFIYVNQAGATRSVIPVATILGIPIISHVRLIEDAEYINSCNYFFFKKLHVISISRFINSAVLKYKQIHQDKVSMMYDLYIPKVMHNDSKLDGKCCHFLCIGRLAKVKGQDVILDAIHEFKRKKFRVKFLGSGMVGSNFDSLLKVKSESLGVEENVVWNGYSSDVFSDAKGACALICPSRIEALGRVIFEAWDMGLVPIVWSGSGGAAEIIKDSGGGILYSKQTGHSLGEAMDLVMNMSVTQKMKLILKGRDWVNNNCSSEVYLKKMLNVWNYYAV